MNFFTPKPFQNIVTSVGSGINRIGVGLFGTGNIAVDTGNKGSGLGTSVQPPLLPPRVIAAKPFAVPINKVTPPSVYKRYF